MLDARDNFDTLYPRHGPGGHGTPGPSARTRHSREERRFCTAPHDPPDGAGDAQGPSFRELLQGLPSGAMGSCSEMVGGRQCNREMVEGWEGEVAWALNVRTRSGSLSNKHILNAPQTPPGIVDRSSICLDSSINKT